MTNKDKTQNLQILQDRYRSIVFLDGSLAILFKNYSKYGLNLFMWDKKDVRDPTIYLAEQKDPFYYEKIKGWVEGIGKPGFRFSLELDDSLGSDANPEIVKEIEIDEKESEGLLKKLRNSLEIREKAGKLRRKASELENNLDTELIDDIFNKYCIAKD